MKGGIFACTNKSKKECITKNLFGAGKMHEDKALDVKKGNTVFLYNIDTDELSGIFKAVSDGKKNIDQKAWRGFYPYQVKVKSNQKINTIKNFEKILPLLNIDWKDHLLESHHVKILSKLLKLKINNIKMIKEIVTELTPKNYKGGGYYDTETKTCKYHSLGFLNTKLR